MAPVQKNDEDTKDPTSQSSVEQSSSDPLTTRDQYGATTSDPLSTTRFEGDVTVSSTGSSTPQQQDKNDIRRRAPFVSRHRKALNHISSDALEARRHPVPAHGMPPAPTEETSLCGKWTASCREAMAEKTPGDWLGTFLPMYSWLKGYPWRAAAVQDLVAGLTGKWERKQRLLVYDSWGKGRIISFTHFLVMVVCFSFLQHTSGRHDCATKHVVCQIGWLARGIWALFSLCPRFYILALRKQSTTCRGTSCHHFASPQQWRVRDSSGRKY
eukprot:scaffold3276_cov168-Amphora_coffeaeformis.AAC.11